MRVDSTFRVMWLLNHSSARAFEVKMLKRIGIEEIFTPKSYPAEISFRSASVSYEDDADLTIPAEDLAVLNAQNWYGQPSQAAWDIANRYFDVCFFTLYKPEAFMSMTARFKGALLWRVYGQEQGIKHGALLDQLTHQLGHKSIQRLGNRFWFAQAYDHLHLAESTALARRKLDLPLGMLDTALHDDWCGGDARILFICPDIALNAHSKSVYLDFKKYLGDMPYVVAGSQAIRPYLDNVIGHVTAEEHSRNLLTFRVMFYHSHEQNNIDDHPFQAVSVGMPLIFMAGGMLDRLGGMRLPGRCDNYQVARQKLKRLLAGDIGLQEEIRQSQVVLLNYMAYESKTDLWKFSFDEVRSQLKILQQERLVRPDSNCQRKKRIAVIIPESYKRGSLRDAKLLSHALQLGAEKADEDVELLLLHLDDASIYLTTEFNDLPKSIKMRSFKWHRLEADAARRAMRYAGYVNWQPTSPSYLVVDDGIKQLVDCDLWIVMSDRCSEPLLPIRPVIQMVCDCLQRYVPILPNGTDRYFINCARSAAQVWTTTEFTRQDALQYAGVEPERVVKLPMLTPAFAQKRVTKFGKLKPYFLWTTSAAQHKNHENAFRALLHYYDELGGQLDCHITGIDIHKVIKNSPANPVQTLAWVRSNAQLKDHLRWQGELADADCQCLLQGAAFLWLAGRIDNEPHSVVAAAHLGVPALCGDHPEMREIDVQFGLNLSWMNANSPLTMAKALKEMEEDNLARRSLLPTQEQLASQSVENLAAAYWKAASACL